MVCGLAAALSGVLVLGGSGTVASSAGFSADATISSTSPYWAGFMFEDPKKAEITAAHGTFVVPGATCVQGENSTSADWVGLGGHYQSWLQRVLGSHAHTTSFETLYQAGVNVSCVGGHQSLQAWDEFYSQSHQNKMNILPQSQFLVRSGESVTVTVTNNPRKAETTWLMTAAWYGHVVAEASGSWENKIKADYTGECIVEDPPQSGGAPANFTNFGSVKFSNCQASNGSIKHSFNEPLPQQLESRLIQHQRPKWNSIATPSVNPLVVRYDGSSAAAAIPNTTSNTPSDPLTPAFNVSYADSTGDTATATVSMGSPEVPPTSAIADAISQCPGIQANRALVEPVRATVTLTSDLAIDDAAIGFNSGLFMVDLQRNDCQTADGEENYPETLQPNHPLTFSLWLVLNNAITPDTPNPSSGDLVTQFLIHGDPVFPQVDPIPASTPWGPRVFQCGDGNTYIAVDTPLPTQIEPNNDGEPVPCNPLTTPQSPQP